MASCATACSAGPIILLERLVKNLTVPSSCLIDRNGKGEGAVMVVRDGKIHRVNVNVGMDTGLRAEIVDGIAEERSGHPSARPVDRGGNACSRWNPPRIAPDKTAPTDGELIVRLHCDPTSMAFSRRRIPAEKR